MADQRINLVESRVKEIADNLVSGLGENCNIFLDTSAVIDLAHEIRIRGKSNPRFTPVAFYNLFNEYLNDRVYVTDEILAESKTHNGSAINGNSIISHSTIDFLSLFNDRYHRVINEESFKKSFSEIDRDVYWAGLAAFDKNHKKCKDDPISYTDRKLLSAALHFRGRRDSSESAILSCDCHLSRTAEILSGNGLEYLFNVSSNIRPDLNNEEFIQSIPAFNYTPIRVVSLRGKH